MPRFQMIIELDTNGMSVQVEYPQDKMFCDYMLNEARRILDRADAERAAASRIVRPADAAFIPTGKL